MGSARLRILHALVVTLAIAACGGAANRSARRGAPGGSLAAVLSTCESNGGTTFLPASDGEDRSSVPDNTPGVCGCWVSWMGKQLSPNEQAAVVTDVVLSASVMALDARIIDRLSAALRSCEPRTRSGPSTAAASDSAVIGPGP